MQSVAGKFLEKMGHNGGAPVKMLLYPQSPPFKILRVKALDVRSNTIIIEGGRTFE